MFSLSASTFLRSSLRSFPLISFLPQRNLSSQLSYFKPRQITFRLYSDQNENKNRSLEKLSPQNDQPVVLEEKPKYESERPKSFSKRFIPIEQTTLPLNRSRKWIMVWICGSIVIFICWILSDESVLEDMTRPGAPNVNLYILSLLSRLEMFRPRLANEKFVKRIFRALQKIQGLSTLDFERNSALCYSILLSLLKDAKTRQRTILYLEEDGLWEWMENINTNNFKSLSPSVPPSLIDTYKLINISLLAELSKNSHCRDEMMKRGFLQWLQLNPNLYTQSSASLIQIWSSFLFDQRFSFAFLRSDLPLYWPNWIHDPTLPTVQKNQLITILQTSFQEQDSIAELVHYHYRFLSGATSSDIESVFSVLAISMSPPDQLKELNIDPEIITLWPLPFLPGDQFTVLFISVWTSLWSGLWCIWNRKKLLSDPPYNLYILKKLKIWDRNNTSTFLPRIRKALFITLFTTTWTSIALSTLASMRIKPEMSDFLDTDEKLERKDYSNEGNTLVSSLTMWSTAMGIVGLSNAMCRLSLLPLCFGCSILSVIPELVPFRVPSQQSIPQQTD